MRVIDGDALSDKIKQYTETHMMKIGFEFGMMRTIDLIQIEPVIDAVPVIRCNDCIFSDVYSARDGRLLVYCCNHGCFGFAPNDYCSRGKKKTE